MKIRFVLLLAPAFLLCACGGMSSRDVHTFAQLEGASSANLARYRRSQLTGNPEQGLDSSTFRFDLFCKLPFDERVVFIMDSFACETLDGEYAEKMYLMLTHPNIRSFEGKWDTKGSTADPEYTAAIFRAIDSYSPKQIKEFCWPHGNYTLFKKNLETWRNRCGCKK